MMQGQNFSDSNHPDIVFILSSRQIFGRYGVGLRPEIWREFVTRFFFTFFQFCSTFTFFKVSSHFVPFNFFVFNFFFAQFFVLSSTFHCMLPHRFNIPTIREFYGSTEGTYGTINIRNKEVGQRWNIKISNSVSTSDIS